MVKNHANKSISGKFNFVLILFLIFEFIISELFKPEIDIRVPFDRFYDFSPAYAIISAIFLAVISLIAGTFLFRYFWNHLITDLFKIREIDFQETLSFMLRLTLVDPASLA